MPRKGTLMTWRARLARPGLFWLATVLTLVAGFIVWGELFGHGSASDGQAFSRGRQDPGATDQASRPHEGSGSVAQGDQGATPPPPAEKSETENGAPGKEAAKPPSRHDEAPRREQESPAPEQDGLPVEGGEEESRNGEEVDAERASAEPLTAQKAADAVRVPAEYPDTVGPEATHYLDAGGTGVPRQLRASSVRWVWGIVGAGG
ncbi:MAG: hypothetical protein HY720_32160 [Planctomycetes bacterium]|nr:hypothetical protein [Planctomycetota bacterium]